MHIIVPIILFTWQQAEYFDLNFETDAFAELQSYSRFFRPKTRCRRELPS